MDNYDKIPYFKDLKINNILIRDCDFTEIDKHHLRFYYKLIENGNDKSGFDFFVIKFYSTENTENNNFFDQESFKGEVLFYGIALWDGMRHLYLGNEQTDNYGYLYYESIKDLRECFEVLEDMLKKHCKEYT